MQIYGVRVNRDDTVQVLGIDVVKETKAFYIIEYPKDYNDPRIYLLGWNKRILKAAAHLTERSALEAYMRKRQQDKANAQAVIDQATKQIASANELLMHLPSSELLPADDAVARAGDAPAAQADHAR